MVHVADLDAPHERGSSMDVILQLIFSANTEEQVTRGIRR